MKMTAARRIRLRDILILQIADTTEADEAFLTTFATELNETTRIPVIMLTEGMTLESLSESQMRDAGWVRSKTPAIKTPATQGT